MMDMIKIRKFKNKGFRKYGFYFEYHDLMFLLGETRIIIFYKRKTL